MRKDMAKILVGRPRKGGRIRTKRRKAHQRPAWVDGDAPRLDSKSRSHGTKYLNENLAPLIRFLRSRRGRVWDDVYSEISEHLRPSNTVQQHVLDHLWMIVERETWVEDGHPMALRWNGTERLDRPGLSRDRFYVCPRTRELREQPYRSRGSHARPLPDRLWSGPRVQLRQLSQGWFALELERIPALASETRCVWDVVHNKRLDLWLSEDGNQETRRRDYGDDRLYAAEKRMLSKREEEIVRSARRKVATRKGGH